METFYIEDPEFLEGPGTTHGIALTFQISSI